MLDLKVAELDKERKIGEKKSAHQQTRLSKQTAELKEEKEVTVALSCVCDKCCVSSDEQVSLRQPEALA